MTGGRDVRFVALQHPRILAGGGHRNRAPFGTAAVTGASLGCPMAAITTSPTTATAPAG